MRIGGRDLMRYENAPHQHVRIPEEIPRQARDDGQGESSPPGAPLNSVVQRATRGSKRTTSASLTRSLRSIRFPANLLRDDGNLHCVPTLYVGAQAIDWLTRRSQTRPGDWPVIPDALLLVGSKPHRFHLPGGPLLHRTRPSF